MMVDVLGDSHTGYFIGRHPPCDSLTIHSHGDLTVRLMKFGTTGSTLRGLRNEVSITGARVKFRDHVETYRPWVLVVVMGDVDCLRHMETPTEDEWIGVSMDSYHEFLSDHVDGRVGRLVHVGCIPSADPAKNAIKREFDASTRDIVTRHGGDFVDLLSSPLVGSDGLLLESLRLRDGIHMHYERSSETVLDLLRASLGMPIPARQTLVGDDG